MDCNKNDNSNNSNVNPFLGLFESESEGGNVDSDLKSKNMDMPASSAAASPDALVLTGLIEEVFNFTFDENSSYLKSSCDAQLVLLNGCVDGVSPDRVFTLESFRLALFERLLLPDPDKHVIKKNDQSFNSHTVQKECILYLFECFKQLKSHAFTSITDETKSSFIKECIDCVILNAATALRQPVLFEPQEIHSQVLSLFQSGEDAGNPDLACFIESIADLILSTDNLATLKEAFSPLLTVIHSDFKKAQIFNYPRYHFTLLNIFSSTSSLAEVFVDYTTPLTPLVPQAYSSSLLGSILSISCLPKVPGDSYDFFDKPFDSNMRTMQSSIWVSLDELGERAHSLVENILRVDRGRLRDRMLSWIGTCLDVNIPRGKLWASMPLVPAGAGFVSDGFSLNLCALLLRLCWPFIKSPNNSWAKLLKIDPTYVSLSTKDGTGAHCKTLATESCLQPTEEGQSRPMASNPVSFMTDIFHMCLRSLDLGTRVVFERTQELFKEIARLQHSLDSSQAPQTLMNTAREMIQQQLSILLSMRCCLLEPTALRMLSQYIASTSVWLVQLLLDPEVESERPTYAPTEFRPISFPFPQQAPSTLRSVPELFLEMIEVFLRLAKLHWTQCLEEGGKDLLEPVLTALIVYMSSNNRTRNPHLRARLAQSLEALLPVDDESNSGLNVNALGIFNRQSLFLHHPHADQIVGSLLNVFVSIEMTGEAVAFEQKFNYRRPMYIVMDYLWKIDLHRASFRKLVENAEQNMEEVDPPLFLRFINLLINDAIFLLDEALSNMAQLRTMTAARENGEWDNLPHEERQRNLQFLHHTGMIARFDNILGKETIHTLQYLSTDCKSLLCHSTMVDRIASMLNYFLYHLVGPKKRNFKVKAQNEYKFEPGVIVKDICHIYIHLGSNEEFCRAVSRDGRSYSPQLFSFANDVLARIGGADLMPQLESLARQVESLSKQLETEEELLADAPEEFLDPIMSTIMKDPVLLPSSNITIDRATIARHLLSDQTDPFNRAPLTMNMVTSNSELKKRIDDWIAEKKQQSSAANR